MCAHPPETPRNLQRRTERAPAASKGCFCSSSAMLSNPFLRRFPRLIHGLVSLAFPERDGMALTRACAPSATHNLTARVLHGKSSLLAGSCRWPLGRGLPDLGSCRWPHWRGLPLGSCRWPLWRGLPRFCRWSARIHKFAWVTSLHVE